MPQSNAASGAGPDTAGDASGTGGNLGDAGNQALGGGQGGDQGTTDHWYSSLPEDLHEDPNVTKYKSMEELARGHVSAVSMLGRDKIPMPKSDDEFREVYKKLGMPETADDYAFAEDAEYKIPEEFYGQDLVEADKAAFREWAHAVGLTQNQFNVLYDNFMKHQEATMQSLSVLQEAEMAKCNDRMVAEWGEAKEANLTVANRALAKLFSPEVVEAIAASGLGRNFDFIQGIYNLGSQSLDELGIDKRGNSTRTPAQLMQEISQLQAHPAYFDRTHPEHRQVNNQVLALMERVEN